MSCTLNYSINVHVYMIATNSFMATQPGILKTLIVCFIWAQMFSSGTRLVMLWSFSNKNNQGTVNFSYIHGGVFSACLSKSSIDWNLFWVSCCESLYESFSGSDCYSSRTFQMGWAITYTWKPHLQLFVSIEQTFKRWFCSFTGHVLN